MKDKLVMGVIGVLFVFSIFLFIIVINRESKPQMVDIISLRGKFLESSYNDRIFISLRQASDLLAELNIRLETQGGILVVQENLQISAMDTALIVPDISLLELLRERELHGEWYGQHNGWLTHIMLEETSEFGPFTATLFRGPFLEVDSIEDIQLVGVYELLVEDNILRFHWKILNNELVQIIEDWTIQIDPIWIQLINPHTEQRIIKARNS